MNVAMILCEINLVLLCFLCLGKKKEGMVRNNMGKHGGKSRQVFT